MKVLDQIFIPEIADIIRDYTYPDYRKIFDSVVRDISWVAGLRAMQMLRNTLPWGEYRKCLGHVIMSPVWEYEIVLSTMAIHLRSYNISANWERGWEKRFFINKKKLK